MDADEFLLLIKINSDTVSEDIIVNIKKKIETRIQNLASQMQDNISKDIFKTINLLFFVSTIQMRLALKNSFSSKVDCVPEPKANKYFLSLYYLHDPIRYCTKYYII